MGVGVDGLLEQPVEEQPAGLRVAAVEPEGVLVEVVRQVRLLDTEVQRADEPALEQRGDQVHAG